MRIENEDCSHCRLRQASVYFTPAEFWAMQKFPAVANLMLYLIMIAIMSLR